MMMLDCERAYSLVFGIAISFMCFAGPWEAMFDFPLGRLA